MPPPRPAAQRAEARCTPLTQGPCLRASYVAERDGCVSRVFFLWVWPAELGADAVAALFGVAAYVIAEVDEKEYAGDEAP